MTNREAGLARILFFGILFFTVDTNFLSEFMAAGFNLKCTNLMGLLSNLELNLSALQYFAITAKVSLFTAAIGLLTPISIWLSFVSLLILNQSALSYCYSNHSLLPAHVAMFLWALLDRGSHFRIDSILRSKRIVPADDTNFLIGALRVYFCTIFFVSGLSKLRHSGIEWITTDSFKNFLIIQNFTHEGNFGQKYLSFLNHWLVSAPYLFHFMAFAAVAFELMAPLALIPHRPRLRVFIVTHLALFQVGIFLTMYINFSSWACLYVCWLPLFSISNFISKVSKSVLSLSCLKGFMTRAPVQIKFTEANQNAEVLHH